MLLTKIIFREKYFEEVIGSEKNVKVIKTMGYELREMKRKNNAERIKLTNNIVMYIVAGLTTSLKMKWEKNKDIKRL